MSETMSVHERMNRARKVDACLRYLDSRKNAHGVDDAKLLWMVEKFDDGLWAELADRANQNPLSETSRAAVLDRLRERVSE